jgi:hypothetical protein
VSLVSLFLMPREKKSKKDIEGLNCENRKVCGAGG